MGWFGAHTHYYSEIARSINPPKPGVDITSRGGATSDGMQLARELAWGTTVITLACACGATKQITHIGQAPDPNHWSSWPTPPPDPCVR